MSFDYLLPTKIVDGWMVRVPLALRWRPGFDSPRVSFFYSDSWFTFQNPSKTMNLTLFCFWMFCINAKPFPFSVSERRREIYLVLDNNAQPSNTSRINIKLKKSVDWKSIIQNIMRNHSVNFLCKHGGRNLSQWESFDLFKFISTVVITHQGQSHS